MTGEDDTPRTQPQGGIRLTAGFDEPGRHTPQEVPELPPYRVLVIGAFGGRGGSERHQLDPSELAGLPGRLGTSIEVAVENRLGGESNMLGDALTFDTIRDFAPKRIAERFAPLADARRLVAGKLADAGRFPRLSEAMQRPRRGPRTDASASTANPPEPPAAPAAGEEPSLDRLLGMVEGAAPQTTQPEAARRAVSAFIAGMGSRAAEGAATSTGAPAEALLREQQAALFEDPGLRDLLEAWQGLRLLVSAMAPDAGTRVELVDVGPRDVVDVLVEVVDVLVDDVVAEESRSGADPLALVVVAMRFGATAADFERLRRIARAAEALQAPALVSFAADLGNGLDVAAAATREEPGLMFSGAGLEIWSALRDEEAARWLAAGWNDVLGRAADDDDGPALWIAPAWVIATQVLRSVASCGWPSEIAGRRGALTGFDVHEVALGGRRAACATAALIPPSACRSLADAGVCALTGTADRDEVLCPLAATVHRPGRFPDDPQGRIARLLSSLPYQLAASRLAALVAGTRERSAGEPADAAAARLEAWLSGLLASTGPGAGATVRAEPHPEDPGRHVLAIEARTGSDVLGGESFAFDIGM